jgi:hypothetical protein
VLATGLVRDQPDVLRSGVACRRAVVEENNASSYTYVKKRQPYVVVLLGHRDYLLISQEFGRASG